MKTDDSCMSHGFMHDYASLNLLVKLQLQQLKYRVARGIKKSCPAVQVAARPGQPMQVTDAKFTVAE